MSIATSYTFLKENVFGSEKVMDWKIVLTGTFTTQAAFQFTAAKFGLDAIDFIEVMPDGSGTNTNGMAILAPNIGNTSYKMYGTGASSGNTFVLLTNPTTVSTMQFIVRVYGVA